MGQEVLGDGVLNILSDQGSLGTRRDNILDEMEGQSRAEVGLIIGGQVLTLPALDLYSGVGPGRRFDDKGEGDGDGESTEVAEGGFVVVVG